MENQHRKISGYRELSQQEIDLMNRIKSKGSELMELIAELQSHLNSSGLAKFEAAYNSGLAGEAKSDAESEYQRFIAAEPTRWVNIGKTDIQTGIMALVRSVAQPQD